MSLRQAILKISGFFSMTSLKNPGAAQCSRPQQNAAVPVCAVLPVESREEAAGSQQHRTFREDRASVIDPLKVVFGDGGHADGTR